MDQHSAVRLFGGMERFIAAQNSSGGRRRRGASKGSGQVDAKNQKDAQAHVASGLEVFLF